MAKILITNDDGIHAEGIRALEAKLRDLGQVIVVAPSHEVSAASHALTLGRPLRIDRIDQTRFGVASTQTMGLLIRCDTMSGKGTRVKPCRNWSW